MEYSVVIHKAEEGGFWVQVPALPGCYSQGESIPETLENVKEAIALYLETLRDDGVEGKGESPPFLRKTQDRPNLPPSRGKG